MDEVFVEVTRAGAVESLHRGSAVVVNASGDVVMSWGDPKRLIFPRSSMKPIQSLVMAETGLQLSAEQWALSGASHHGEDIHINHVQSWLNDLGRSQDDLICGPAWPEHGASRKHMVQDGKEAARIVHNCSGKHCGHLATCAHMGWDHQGYDQLEHPFQKQMITRFSELCNEEPAVIGVDGCSLPAPQCSLYGFALGLAKMAKMVRDGDPAAEAVFQGATAFPELTGGTTAQNGIITKLGKGKYYAKNGAEGMYSVIIPEAEAAIALKASDGFMRGADLAIVGVLTCALQHLGMDAGGLQSISHQVLKNADGLPVGEVRLAQTLF